MKSTQGMKEIGRWLDLARYFEDSNGVAWCWHSSGQVTNCGPVDQFRANFKNRYRGELYATQSAK